MVKKHQIEAAYLHSIREHNIGETDGFPPEVAADLGFETYEKALEISKGKIFEPLSVPETTVGHAGAIAASEALRSKRPSLPPSTMDQLIAHQQKTYGTK